MEMMECNAKIDQFDKYLLKNRKLFSDCSCNCNLLLLSIFGGKLHVQKYIILAQVFGVIHTFDFDLLLYIMGTVTFLCSQW